MPHPRLVLPILTGILATLVVPDATADVDRSAPPAHRPVVVQPATTIAPGLTFREFTGSGPVVGQILEADLTEPTLQPTYLYPGSVAARTPLTEHAERADAIAGVNGDFFDIGATEAPLGVGLDDGQLVNAPATGWNNAAAFAPDPAGGAGTTASLTDVALDATVALPDGTTLPATNLNSPEIAADGIGIYTPAWGTEDRSQVVDGVTLTRARAVTTTAGESIRLPRQRAGLQATTYEVEITDGVVTRVSTTPGGAVADGAVAVLGVGAGAEALAGLGVGDRVAVDFRPASAVDASVAITGNVVLLRDGVVVAPEHPRHPRTAVGFSADGTRVWLVTVDGRSDASVGMTYVRLATLLKSLGADDALNLDGGGSTTMVARMPGDDTVTVRNNPSDGAQRPVPNGIGFVTGPS